MIWILVVAMHPFTQRFFFISRAGAIIVHDSIGRHGVNGVGDTPFVDVGLGMALVDTLLIDACSTVT